MPVKKTSPLKIFDPLNVVLDKLTLLIAPEVRDATVTGVVDCEVAINGKNDPD